MQAKADIIDGKSMYFAPPFSKQGVFHVSKTLVG